MKNFKVIILIIVLLIIVLGGFLIVYTNRGNNQIPERNIAYSLEDNTQTFNEISSANNSENATNVIETNISNENTQKGKFNIIEVDENTFKDNYTVQQPFDIINKEYFNIEKENSNLTISLIQSDINKELLRDTKNIKYAEKYTINNVSTEEVNTVFCGGEGQDLVYPVVYLLLNNGTVKSVNIEEGYKTGVFNAEIISNLENVQKIEQADVTPKVDSGYVAVIATTEDGKIYEIRN